MGESLECPVALQAENESGRRILLAGAGYLCRRAATLLLAGGDQVWGLRRRPPPFDTSGIRWLKADLTRPSTLRLPASISHVIYAPSPEMRNRSQYHAVFIEGLQNLMSAFGDATPTRFMFVSSSSVYGDHGDAWLDETTPVNPPDFNGEILVQAEQWLSGALPGAVVLRLSGLYGPGRTQLLERLKAGSVRAPGPTAGWANRFHIEDAAGAVVHLLNLHDAAPCYIGTDNQPHRIGDLYTALAGMLSTNLPARVMEQAEAQRPGMSGAGATNPGSTGTRQAGTASATGEPAAAAAYGERRRRSRLSNARLRASGFEPAWPDAIAGYRALVRQMQI